MAKPNTIKRLLSYFFDFSLESRSSELNKTLSVVLSRGRFRLDAENATYSFEDKYRSFYTAFEKTKLANKKLKDILVLGLGLGSIPVMLEKNFNQNLESITAVELDPVVVDLAKKYLPTSISQKTDFVCEDAFNFKNPSNKKYDLIAFDVFIDDFTDEQFRSTEYLQSLKNLLTNNGTLYYNLMTDNRESQQRAELFLGDAFRVVFPDGVRIDTGGNWVLVNASMI